MTQTISTQTFGEFAQEIPASEEYLTINFSPSSAPRKRRWSNYGLSADFLGDYFAAFFPGDTVEDSPLNRRETVKAAVSYIANELLENAVKYSDEVVKRSISISLYLYEDKIIFQSINHTSPAIADKYCRFIQQVLTSDLDELYTQQLEQTALGNGESNMGLLTMMNDYAARFGWQFQTSDSIPDTVQVNVLVHLDI
jgi:hypothetical protein